MLAAHAALTGSSGGAEGVRDRGMLESAVARPRSAFGGQDLYPTLAEKAAALCHSLVLNHPFIDGNKRIGHAMLEALLLANGSEIVAEVGEAEATILSLAAGTCSLEDLTEWVRLHTQPAPPTGSSP